MKKAVGLVLAIVFLAVASMFTASCNNSNPTDPATETPTTVVVPTATNTPVPRYDFETPSQLADWSTEALFGTVVATDGAGHTGANYVSATVDFNATTVDAYFYHTAPWDSGINGFPSFDMTGKTLSVWVNIPAGMVDAIAPYRCQVFIQNQAWQWEAKAYNITASGWQKFTMGAGFDYTLGGCTFSNPTNVTDIIKWGIKLERGSSTQDCTEAIAFDDINW
ncbi:MAG: hypothetical protein LLG37_04165 [Spirochaetia bacterium]|nr:hypothetical protein [Spirochaetia bacterium]